MCKGASMLIGLHILFRNLETFFAEVTYVDVNNAGASHHSHFDTALKIIRDKNIENIDYRLFI